MAVSVFGATRAMAIVDDGREHVTSHLVAVDVYANAPTSRPDVARDPPPPAHAALRRARASQHQQRDRRRLAVARLVHDALDDDRASLHRARHGRPADARRRLRRRPSARRLRHDVRRRQPLADPHRLRGGRRPHAARAPTRARRPTPCSSACTRSTSSARSPAAASSRPPSRRSSGSRSGTRSSPGHDLFVAYEEPGRMWVALGGGPIIRNGIALLRGLQQHINDHGAVPERPPRRRRARERLVRLRRPPGRRLHVRGAARDRARAPRRRPGLARPVQRRQPALLRHPARGHHRRAGRARHCRRRPQPPQGRPRLRHRRTVRHHASCPSPTWTRGARGP